MKGLPKYNFTFWLVSELNWGKGLFLTYVPFLPLVFGFVETGLKSINEVDLSQEYVFDWSILAQVIIIFIIIIYQVLEFRKTETNSLLLKIGERTQFENYPYSTDRAILFEFTHTNGGQPGSHWKNFRNDFNQAMKNIFWFKVAWMVLWINWFCLYVAVYIGSDSHTLFSFFQITETLSFAACYFLLSRQIFEGARSFVSQFWWAFVMIAILLAISIIDQTLQSLAPRLHISAIKTLIGCTFLGLLVGTLTKRVQHSPHWVQIALFFYVALQPLLFVSFDLPDFTKGDFKKLYPVELTEAKPLLDKQKRAGINEALQLTPDIKDLKYDQALSVGVFTPEDIKLVESNSLGVQNASLLARMDAVNWVASRLHFSLQVLKVLMFNFSLVLKYLLMFYVIWLLRFDHLLIYYLRTQGDKEFMDTQREAFEKEI